MKIFLESCKISSQLPCIGTGRRGISKLQWSDSCCLQQKKQGNETGVLQQEAGNNGMEFSPFWGRISANKSDRGIPMIMMMLQDVVCSKFIH